MNSKMAENDKNSVGNQIQMVGKLREKLVVEAAPVAPF